MSKKTRLIILLICVAVFLIIMPYILLYSLGYRVDFENRKIVTTGGIYVRVLPQGADVVIDSKISNKTGLLSNAVFVQNLLPKQHNVLVKKDGYYEYQKNLNVKENEVTKLENVILFKKNIVFEVFSNQAQSPFNQPAPQDKFIIKNNNLYYSDISANANLTQIQKNIAVIKNIVAYTINGNNIIWLGLDGFLYNSNSDGKNPETISKTALKITTAAVYKIFVFNQKILLKENNNLLLFGQDEKILKDFYSNAADLKISPNGQKLLYYNDHEILFSDINNLNGEKILLNRFSEKITDCYWLNDDYVIFQLGDPPSLNASATDKFLADRSAGQSKIIISEIDVRGNVNTVELPQTISLANGTAVDLKNFKISFNQQDKKLYILNQDKVFASEKLVP